MTLAGTERRRRQLITAGLGTALTLVMGTVLIMGFRLATHVRANIGSLQTASTLQTYPEEISQQLNSLRLARIRAYLEPIAQRVRSEEHTSELQSLRHLVCRLLLEKKKQKKT